MTGVGAALKLEHRRANSPPRHRSFRRRRVYVRAVGASRRFQRCRPSAFIPRENGKMIGGKLANISRVRPGEGPGYATEHDNRCRAEQKRASIVSTGS